MIQRRIAILIGLLALESRLALDAELGHGTANAALTQKALSDLALVTDEGDRWRYTVFARRDAIIADRTLLNAAVTAAGKFGFAGQFFYLGLGTHFTKAQIGNQPSGNGIFLPAAIFRWQNSHFTCEVLSSEKLTRSQLSFLIRIGIPVEFNSAFEYVESQAYRWSLDIFFHVFTYAGWIGGYEPVAIAPRTGLWLKPLENLSLKALSRIPLRGEMQFEFSIAYAWRESPAPDIKPTVRLDEEPPPAKQKAETKVPAFAILVKWGLTPVVALKLAREKNICALDHKSRAILAQHHWECRDAN